MSLFTYLSIYWSIYLFIYLFANNKGHKIWSGSWAAWKEKHGAYFRRSKHCLRSLGLSGNQLLCVKLYINHETQCFVTRWNSELEAVFHLVMKHCVKKMLHITSQTKSFIPDFQTLVDHKFLCIFIMNY